MLREKALATAPFLFYIMGTFLKVPPLECFELTIELSRLKYRYEKE